MKKIPEGIQWFGLGLILSLCVTTAFGSGNATSSEMRERVQKKTKECGIKARPAHKACLDFEKNPQLRKDYENFAKSPLLATAKLAERGVKLSFAPSPYFKCALTGDDLRQHPEAVGIQQTLVSALEQITIDEPRFAEVIIETDDPVAFDGGFQRRFEVRGGTLVIRGGFGECDSLLGETKDMLRIEIIRQLFSMR